MEKKIIIKKTVTVALLAAIVFLQLCIVILSSSAAFINRKTAAYVWFGIPFEDASWDRAPSYIWDSDQEYTDANNDIVDTIPSATIYTEMSADLLTPFLNELGKFINEGVDIEESDISILDISNNKDLLSYIDEFVQMQSGYIIGDNEIPIPNIDAATKLWDEAVNNYASENTISWYNENRTMVVHSFCKGLSDLNNDFSADQIGSYDALSDSFLIFKVLNRSIASFILLIILGILVFACWMINRPNFFYTSLFFAQIFAVLLSFLTLFGIDGLTFVILGQAILPTQTIMENVKQIVMLIISTYGVATLVLGIVSIRKYKLFELMKEKFQKK